MTITIIVLIAFALVLTVWWIYRNRKAEWEPEEVALLIETILDGSLDSREWDYFVHVEIDDKKLNEIRESVADMWVLGSRYMERDAIDPCRMNEQGRERLKGLLEETRRLCSR